MRPVLVDSCYYIALGRKGVDPISHLTAAAELCACDLATCGVVRCEVGRGIRFPRVLAQFQAFWDVLLYVPTDNSIWEKTEQLAWELARQGYQPPLQDLLIAQCALKIDAAVLTLDKHFQLIPDLKIIDRLI